MEHEQTERTSVALIKGKMVNGTLNGFCSTMNSEGEAFTGNLLDGQPHGEGLFKRLNGEYQKGSYENGKFITGECNWRDGNVRLKGKVQNGELADGIKTVYVDNKILRQEHYDKGTLTFTANSCQFNNLTFVGEIADGKAKGKGKLFDENETLVGEGEFSDNLLVKGYQLGNKDSTFINGKINGLGKMSIKESIFVGNFVKGKLCGLGAEIGTGYLIKIGNFQKNVFVEGIRWRDFVLEQGKFENDLLTGEGLRQYYLGEKQGGQFSCMPPEEFKNWKEHCLTGGDLNEVKKSIFGGECLFFEKGQFKNGCLNGQGESTLNGCTREGSFWNGMLHGEGKKKYPDGKIEKGKFYKDELESKLLAIKERRRLIPKKPDSSSETENPVDNKSLNSNSYSENDIFDKIFEEGYFEDGRLIFGKISIEHCPKHKIIFEIREGFMTNMIRFKNNGKLLEAEIRYGSFFSVYCVQDNRKITEISYGKKGSFSYPFITKEGLIVNDQKQIQQNNEQTPSNVYRLYGIGEIITFDTTQKEHVLDIFFDDLKIRYSYQRDKIFAASKNNYEKYETLPTNLNGKALKINKKSVLFGDFVEGNFKSGFSFFPSSNFYQGNFVFGLFDKGVFVQGTKCIDSKFFIGNFAEGVMVGEGIIITEDFKLKIGNFKNKSDWTGKLISRNLIQEGTFVNDKLHGKGSVIIPSAHITGIFENGKLDVFLSSSGKTKVTHADIDLSNEKSPSITFYYSDKEAEFLIGKPYANVFGSGYFSNDS